MKTFKDLKFKKHSIAKVKQTKGFPDYSGARQALLQFDNGYGVSVLFGNCFYSNGRDSYELAVTYKGELSYSTPITNDVLGYKTKSEVTKIMKKVQELK